MNAQKILIVEDDILSAEYLRDILNDHGYFICGIASNAKEAIRITKDTKPDLIIMDVILSDNITGCEAAVEIRQDNKSVKIIFLTAHSEDEMIEYAQRSKANSYLLKPYRDEELLATVAVVLSDHKTDKAYEVKEVVLSNTLSYNLHKNHLLKDGQHIALNTHKQKLIGLLIKNINTTISNEQICQVVWGESKSDSTLRSLIYRTKQIIGEDLIKNINGVGYTIKI